MSTAPAPTDAAATPCPPRNRTALLCTAAGLLAAIVTAGWFSDEIAEQFAPRPSPDALFGMWSFDADRYRAQLAEMPGDPGMTVDRALVEAQVREAQQRFARLQVLFTAEGVAVSADGRPAAVVPGRYETSFPTTIAFVPLAGGGKGKDAGLAVIDRQRPGVIAWSAGDLSVPLRRD